MQLESILKEIEPKLANGMIPRVGDDGKSVDLYTVGFYFEGAPLYLLESIDGSLLTLKAWYGRRFSLDATSTFEMVEKLDIRIVHYHGSVILIGRFGIMWSMKRQGCIRFERCTFYRNIMYLRFF
ncbi:hypothetical protein [Vibrio europaeus]|uniref:Immunity protein 63 domain-containing protein n=1 Tax=Vibrio europaeus TaxID=300876 RepID=A0ABT5H3G6_9VIBR|nr:hypothetical protein [Vibrio europaeus]MDC5706486.1 hypothetical protein [Vibrio europaeus]MDC5711981.1 hypothetical protein [Vibrio europaeus]MDC5716326.1 hypothetical protein [Vibrio europaeus]MDC5725897.1 hypothetical protein [Vibrio europaeus]MDC5732886.1 hypothetical protein [Vibrio europaeus]